MAFKYLIPLKCELSRVSIDNSVAAEFKPSPKSEGMINLRAKRKFQSIVSIYGPEGYGPSALPLSYSEACANSDFGTYRNLIYAASWYVLLGLVLESCSVRS